MMARSAFEVATLNTRWWVCAVLTLFLLARLIEAKADAEAPERIAWRKTPIAVELAGGAERVVHFPEAVTVGVPPQLQGALRVQSIAGTLYLLAHQSFEATRVIVRGTDNGQVYLLDLSALVDAGSDAPLVIYLPDDDPMKGAQAAAISSPPQYGYVTLTRFAAQELYAPARLLQDLPGVIRIPTKREPVALVRGDAVEAMPLVSWRAGDLYVTAAKLTNKTDRPQTLDPRTLRGRWLTAAFQHNRLHEAGSEADRTVVYLISDRPFAASLR